MNEIGVLRAGSLLSCDQHSSCVQNAPKDIGEINQLMLLVSTAGHCLDTQCLSEVVVHGEMPFEAGCEACSSLRWSCVERGPAGWEASSEKLGPDSV